MGCVDTYHQHHDNGMMSYLLLAPWREYVKRRHAMLVAIFSIVGLSRWVPGRMTQFEAMQITQRAIWISGVAIQPGRTAERLIDDRLRRHFGWPRRDAPFAGRT